MVELIGLLHREENLRTLVDYVDQTFGTPESLMLELPLDWREQKDSLLTKDTFFYRLAEEYETRGSEIIAGDPNRYVHSPRLSKRVSDIEEKLKNKEFKYETIWAGLKDLRNLLVEIIKYKVRVNHNLLIPSKMEERNQGFLSAYKSSQPDLIIVGDTHAQYLKRNRPELHYTYFLPDTFYERFAYSMDPFRIQPDKLQVSPLSCS